MRMQPLKAAVALTVLTALSFHAGAQSAPERGITRVAGDLYRAQNNQHYTVFLVTPEGIVLSDPISTEFSEWLRAELEQRFDVPVRYVAYSHHHWDHASGGEVFADTAEFVGHEAMPPMLALPSDETALPSEAALLDVNDNGLLEEGEADADLAARFELYDADDDDALTGAEIARGPLADVHPPETLFDERHTITLGGKTVEMIHVGPTHSPDMSVLRFPDEGAVFLVDFISVKRLPFQNLPGYDIEQITQTIRDVEALDFTVAVGGHGDIGTKEDVADHRRYLEELRDAVAAGIEQGQSLEQLQASVTMDDYRSWTNYDTWLEQNIAGMYRILTSDD